jgi:hypothetical protein
MDFYTLAALPLSAERGWPELLRARPGGWHLFLQIVLPVALLPPAVLYLAGTVGPPGSKAGSHPWGELSMLVLLAEFGSVALAGRLLRHIAGAYALVLAPHEARLLAALAPLPLWASAAGFALPGQDAYDVHQMNPSTPTRQAEPLNRALQQAYAHGFVTDVETDSLPPGLDEDTVRAISRRKREPEFLLKLAPGGAFERWRTLTPPRWGRLRIDPIDFQALSYYSAPKSLKDGPKSLADVDPKLLETYEKLGVPLHERARLAGVAVDAVFDSVSVAPPSASSSPRSA